MTELQAAPAPARRKNRFQTHLLITVAVTTVVAAMAVVVGFNLASDRLFDSSRPMVGSGTSQRAGAQAPSAAPATVAEVGAGAAAAPGAASPAPAGSAPAPTNTNGAAAVPAAFAPPAVDAMPDGPMGDVVRRGEQIFINTRANAAAYVGNSLNCVNCHLDAGRKADSAPLWGAYTLYPAYRSKTKHVDTFAERLRGCFEYSMNGKAPPFGDDVLVALEAYAYWMAKGAPTGERLPGAGYPKQAAPAQAPDGVRGKAVYEAQCALCHGADGQGQRVGEVQAFPPLWGPQSYNWGAGMHSVDNAAAFVRANMPLGKGGSLSVQEAWDVAWYINSHERPQDPRFTGDVAATRAQFHDSPHSLYGTTVDGKLLGSKAY